VPADATSIVLNIAAVAPSDPGFITIFPCGVSRPNAANLNFVAGRNVANAVIAKVGAGGKVCIFTSAATDVVVDVSGDFTSFTSFAPLTAPARLLDTRPPPDGATIDGQTVGVGRRTGGTVFELPVAGRAGVPGDAGTVVLNVTAVSPSGPGYLTVYPCGVPRPNAANVTYVTGQIVPNAVIAKLGDGKVCVFTYATTDLVIDVAGTLV